MIANTRGVPQDNGNISCTSGTPASDRQATGCPPEQQKDIEKAVNDLEIIRFTKREDQWGPLVSEVLRRMLLLLSRLT